MTDPQIHRQTDRPKTDRQPVRDRPERRVFTQVCCTQPAAVWNNIQSRLKVSTVRTKPGKEQDLIPDRDGPGLLFSQSKSRLGSPPQGMPFLQRLGCLPHTHTNSVCRTYLTVVKLTTQGRILTRLFSGLHSSAVLLSTRNLRGSLSVYT